ncbi:MAG: glucosiduronase [Acidobacteriaceae bacterium]|nr:glucosiduronase [Acidobacteriaceae bacterium]
MKIADIRATTTVAPVLAALWCLASAAPAKAETGYDAWLRDEPLSDRVLTDMYDRLPATVVMLNHSPVMDSAGDETIRGVRGLLGRTLRKSSAVVPEGMIVLGTLTEARQAFSDLHPPSDLDEDGYWLKSAQLGGHDVLLILAPNDRGVLYGAFALLRRIALHQRVDALDEESNPYAPIRWVNQWDNLDGSIERGYGGRSIFFENGEVRPDLRSAADYARLLASLGIDGCTINNVNANPKLLTSEMLPQVARLADAFRPWGVRLSLSVDLGSPETIGGLDTFDPLEPFADNAAVQIKYGPIDFQAREPVSPLIGGLERTNETLELQITQEYTGQQRHVCFLVPMWKQVLNFDLRVSGRNTPVKDIVSGKAFQRPMGGLVGVANVGLDENWLGSDLAMANLYGFGRLAWNPDLTSREIAEEWTQLTYGHDARVTDTIATIQLESWRVYEGYTGPLGLGTLTDILHGHYGPGIESAERNGWGQWIRADHEGVGMDRTIATGTGYVGQYSPSVAALYESVKTTPDNLVLFFHHLPYTDMLRSGKTVIQEIYDSHYEAAAEAQEFPEWWKTLRGRIDEQRYQAVLLRLEYQAGHAIVWRDAICEWFLRESGIPDAKGRVGHYPGRVEAEAMKTDGYLVENVTPWEDASGGRAITCAVPGKSCTASFPFTGAAGWYDLDVQYFDVNTGLAKFQLFVGDQLIRSWTADAQLPGKAPNGDTATRERISEVALRPGDEIRIVGTPDGGDHAALDYVAIKPHNP